MWQQWDTYKQSLQEEIWSPGEKKKKKIQKPQNHQLHI